MRHCGYFTVRRLSGDVPTFEDIHYVVNNFSSLDFVCEIHIFVKSEVKIHQIAGDSEMF